MTQKHLIEILAQKYKEKVRADDKWIWIGQAKMNYQKATELAKA